MKKLILIIAILSMISCSKNTESDCTAEMLDEFGMVEYNGQDLDCHSWLQLYEFKNQQFFVFNNYCIDFSYMAINCSNDTLCNTGSDFSCNQFKKNATLIEIVGIRE